MATNRGSFELKYFFTASIASADGGEAHSAEAVRHHIKQLIDAEAAAAILSDDTIVERLRESGIDIARRTVAKYREAMRIPSSVQRRRDKQSTLSKDGFGFRTDCSLHLDSGITLEADSNATDAYASADQALLMIEKRLRRYKSRLKDRSARKTYAATAALAELNGAGLDAPSYVI